MSSALAQGANVSVAAQPFSELNMVVTPYPRLPEESTTTYLDGFFQPIFDKLKEACCFGCCFLSDVRHENHSTVV